MKLYRADNLLNLDQLSKLTLTVFGLGSLGSLVTSLLAYPWGRIILVDPEKLEDDNVERHLLGYSQVGRYKVEGMRDWLVDRGVDASRIFVITDVTQTEKIVSRSSILVVSIDDPKPCYEINQLAVNYNVPAVYGGVYPKGTGGQTVVVPTPSEACYLCSDIKMGVFEYKGRDVKGNYGVDPLAFMNSAGKITAVPSLKYSISAIASDMALAVMDILSGVAEPQILVHAQNWEGIVNLPSSSVGLVQKFIDMLNKMGMNQTMQIVLVGKTYQLQIRQGKLAHSLTRVQGCVAHGSSVSADDI